MVTIKYIPNIASREGRWVQYLPFYSGSSLARYLKLAGADATGHRYILNGAVVDNIIRIYDEDEVIVAPKVALPGIIALFGSGLLQAIITAASYFAVGYSIYLAIKGPSKPNYGMDGWASSPTYNWDGILTQQDIGVPIPIVYGEHRVGGNIINQLIRTDGNSNYLNLLLAIAEGEIESIGDVQINGNPIENYTDVYTTKKYGTNDQTAISSFEELHNLVAIGTKLVKDSAYAYTTQSGVIEAVEFRFNFPSGLYKLNGDGSSTKWYVLYKIEHRLHEGGGGWTDDGSYLLGEKMNTSFDRIFRLEFTSAGQWDVRVTRKPVHLNKWCDPVLPWHLPVWHYDYGDEGAEIIENQYYISEMYLSQIDEIETEKLVYPNTALLAVEVLATDKISGSRPDITSVVKGRKIKCPKIMYGGIEVDWDDYYWDPATSEYKRLSDGDTCSWDGVTYADKWCANPAWIIYDLLINTRYGLGEYVGESQVNLSAFLAESRYCEEKVPDGSGGYEKRFRLDVVIDQPLRTPDLIAMLCSACRGIIFWSDSEIVFRIDKPASAVQVFGMGNIIVGSYQQSWKAKKDIPAAIEVQFSNKALNYAPDIVTIADETLLLAGAAYRKKTVRVMTTSKSQALREGRYLLWLGKYCDEIISFKVAIDAVACQPFDIISVSHDVPQWGFSGRILAGSLTQVTIDRDVVFEDGKSYKVLIRYADDTLEEIAVTAGAQANILLFGTTPSKTPVAYDVFSFGEVTKTKRDFRIIYMKRNADDECEITAVNYEAAVYDDSAVVLPTNNYSALTLEIPDVTGLNAVERLQILKDGTLENAIDVFFSKPAVGDYQMKKYNHAEIYLSDDGGLTWELRGSTSGTMFAIGGGLIDGITYTVAVCSVGESGEKNLPADSPQDTVTIIGKTAPPSDVTGFDVYQEGSLLRFKCNLCPDVDFARFIVKKGTDWAIGSVIAEGIDVTRFLYPAGEIGTITFMIKAVDTSGSESTNAAFDTLDVEPPPERNFVQTLDVFAANFEWERSTDCGIQYGELYDASYVRKILSLQTAITWEEREAEVQTWEYQESGGGLMLDDTFVTSEQTWEQKDYADLGFILNGKLILDADYQNVSGGSLTIQVNYSEDAVTWSGWADVDADAQYRFRYVKFKIKLQTSAAACNINLYGLTVYVAAPVTKVDYGSDLAVPSGGITIRFGVEFTFPPSFRASIVNGVTGFLRVYDKTITEVKARIYEDQAQTTPIGGGEIDWEAKGY